MTSNRGVVVLVVGLAGLLLALAGVSAWQGTARLSGRGNEREAVATAARAFAKAYGGFDYRDPAGYRDHLLTMTTGTIHAVLAASEADPVAVAQRRTTSMRVASVEVTALAGHQATAVVVADQERIEIDPASGLQREEIIRQHLMCRLARVDGRWLVAEVRLLGEQRPGLGMGS
jgi:hypothetical protein